jgi:hypothetical protein
MVLDIGYQSASRQIMSALRDREEWPDLARLVEDDIRRALPAPEHLRAAWQEMGKLSLLSATHNLPLDRDAVGHRLESLIASELELLSYLRARADEVRSHGQNVPSLPQLLETIRKVEALRSEALDNWPWTPTKQEWDEAAAEFERGEGVDIDDAFAEAAGVSREEWLRLVEERRRTEAGAGQ